MTCFCMHTCLGNIASLNGGSLPAGPDSSNPTETPVPTDTGSFPGTPTPTPKPTPERQSHVSLGTVPTCKANGRTEDGALYLHIHCVWEYIQTNVVDVGAIHGSHNDIQTSEEKQKCGTQRSRVAPIGFWSKRNFQHVQKSQTRCGCVVTSDLPIVPTSFKSPLCLGSGGKSVVVMPN